jgi:hypothetical protein
VRDASERGAKLFEAEGEGRGWAVRGGGARGFSRRPAWSAAVLSSGPTSSLRPRIAAPQVHDL